ncbi:MAG: glycosyltransferase family 2 protein [Bacteroidetes bacterium]|nr:glycosyltransferase family 2 protein [Bacteroidota bacterium]MDA1336591.1 glycosyltransferase family 2 protein [Bacteroidota bacterium]
MELSIVVPLFNEEESLRELKGWIDKVLSGRAYEIIFIDDGSRDGSWQVVQEIAQADPARVVGIRMAKNYGKSAGLHLGFGSAKGKVVVTMDADLQDSPEEIPELERKILEEGFDMVSGWKKKRHDPISKTIPTRLYNAATRWVSGIQLHDFNCGLKAYRLEVVKAIELQGEMHRYIPILAKSAGYDRIGEQVVQHQARKYGSSKFGMERFINGFLDLMTIGFMSRFSRKPMHFFGSLGVLMFLGSLIGFSYIAISKWISILEGNPTRNITEISAFYVSLIGMVIGAQFFLTGFLAEMTSRNDPRRHDYQVTERVIPK